jgi:FAD/FMN-containing dehydrogenase
MSLTDINHHQPDYGSDWSAVDPAAIDALRDIIRGDVVSPADASYERARQVWNGAHSDQRPALVVRGGGHSVAGFSTTDGGIVIDLSPMNDVHVDAAARRASVGGGAVWADVDHETQAYGLATTGGLVSTTGVAGFTLGGGIGWLMRKYGLAADNLVGADLVTADGRLIRVSETENPELLWGLRGGGGNFGIVTRFEFALHEVGPVIYAGPVFFSADADADLMRTFREWAPSASDDVTAVVNLTTAPPLPVIPEAWHGKRVAAVIAASAGPVAEGEEHVRELRSVAEPVADLLGPMPYGAIQTLIDPLWPKGIHAYFKSTNLARLDDELIAALVELHRQAPGPQCEIHVHQMGGAIARVGDGGTAFGQRSMPFVLNAVTGWHEPEAAQAHIQWARAVIDAASEASTGRAYVNFLGDASEARAAYGEGTYERLVALKNTYDPTNVFALNQNIQPDSTDVPSYT